MNVRFRHLLLRIGILLAVACVAGCAVSRPPGVAWARPFVFGADTFAYPNELIWEYEFEDGGHSTHHRRQPPATYSHRCFVVARSARLFFQHAAFDPSLPRADEAGYRRQIRRVLAMDPRAERPDWPVLFPGYTNLSQFSRDHEALLKSECGSAWVSYFQTGHWRMVLPFSRRHQERTAGALAASIRRHRPPVVHVVRFPSLAINHALLLYGVRETDRALVFDTYDPNSPERATTLTFDRTRREFSLPRSLYFVGGRVAVYEVYHRLGY